MNLDNTIHRLTKEIVEFLPWSDFIIEDVKQYLIIAYSAGFDEGRNSLARKHPVIQMDKYGREIQEFESMAAAARAVHGDKSHIRKACINNTISKGYKWKYK